MTLAIDLGKYPENKNVPPIGRTFYYNKEL